MNSKINWL